MSNMDVAKTIVAQIGRSTGAMTAMIGAYNFIGSDNSLTFRFKARASNGVNCVRITLEPSDTYKVEFISIRGSSVKVKSSHDDIYADSLKNLFEKETGLYLSIGTIRF